MINAVDPVSRVVAVERRQGVKFEFERFDFAQLELPGFFGEIAERGKAGPIRWIVVADQHLFEQERLLAQAHEWWLLLAGVALVVVHQRLVEQGKESAQQQRDAYGVCFIRLYRQVNVLSLRLAHALRGNGKLQAGAGEETPFVAIVQPGGNIGRGSGQPVEPRGMHQLARKGHQCAGLQRAQLEQERIEFRRRRIWNSGFCSRLSIRCGHCIKFHHNIHPFYSGLL